MGMFHIKFTFIQLTICSIMTVQIQLLPDCPQRKCCVSQRVPAELPGFWTVYNLAWRGGGGGWEDRYLFGPKVTDKSFWQTKMCHVQRDNSKSRNNVLIIEIHHCQNARDVIWTINMFIPHTLSEVQ